MTATEITIKGILFQVYAVRGQWKVVHCTRNGRRLGRSIVTNVKNVREGRAYAEAYAAA